MGRRRQPEPRMITLGSQAMISVYLARDDYHVLKGHANRMFGQRKMATVVRIALREYFERLDIDFTGRDPGEPTFEET